MIFSSLIISLIYSFLMLVFVKGFHSLKNFTYQNSKKKTDFSVIIPCRNEAQNLPALFHSLSQLNYPNDQFEIIFINDDSNDGSVELIKNFKNQYTSLNIRLLENKRKSNSPKKDAIETAIKKSNFNWILTTDADCKVPKNWLKAIDQFIQKEDPKMIVAPVAYEIQNGFFNRFQNLDFMSLQAVTMAGFGIQKPFLCNGANLCYSKKKFIEIHGFLGNNNIASGDDIFMLEKMLDKYPEDVKYLKSYDAIVNTKAQKNISNLLNQRIRWASKTGSYNSVFGKFIGLIIFVINFYLVLLFILSIFNLIPWSHTGLVFMLKFNLDFLILYPTALFFKQQKVLSSYVFSSITYPFFCSTVVVLSLFKKYEWKGRAFSQ